MLKQKFKYMLRQTIPTPYVPIKLVNDIHVVEKVALVDTGASVNVIPHHVGIQLGFT